jgi:S-DNA-T family DNA segregation ATPase FtsK/SpoIIIE
MRLFTFWRDLDDDDKERVIKITGLLIAVFAIFTLLANVSYLFTWKTDQSLLSTEISDKSIGVSNICGKLGFKWSYFLITQCFGLGSFAFILILFAISMRLLLKRWHYSMLKTLLLTLTGAIIASFVLAFISNMTGFNNAFGGGLGGQCGASSVSWMTNLLGNIVTGVILVVAVILWLLFASRRFKHWAAGIGKDNPSEDQKEKEPETEEVKENSEAPKVVDEYPDSQPEPKPERDSSINLSGFDSKPETKPEPAPAEESKPEGTLEIQRGEGLSTEIKKELEPYDSKSELPDYKPLSLDLLDVHESTRRDVSNEEITRNNNKIRATLENFKIQVQDVKAIVGPTVTLYKVYPAPGVKIAGIKRIQEDIGMYLHAKGVRVITLPDSVGIEVANDNPSIVPLRAVLNDEAFRNSKAELPVAIGYTIQQKVKVFDLADAPHLLVAGATKQGKSVCLNVIVSSLLYSKHPSEMKFVFIDPKMVEFSAYERLLHHYLAVLPDFHDEDEERMNAIVKNPKLAEKVLRSLCKEMDNRYELLSKAYVQKISQYNDKYNHHYLRSDEGHHFLPYIVVVIDEYADLTMSVGATGEAKTIARSISTSIIRLAQKGRAAGIHVIIATQRPSVDVITGLIKSNFPTRIAFRVVSRIDSATILDSPGAEKLIGRGDMLYYAGVETERVQCALVTNEEIAKITKAVSEQVGYKKSYNTPYYLPSVDEQSDEGDGGMIDMKDLDERFEEAAKMVVTTQRGSTSDLQRRLGMGYAKAGRVMDQLEAAGIVGPQEGSKPRQVLISSLDELEKVLEAYRQQ